MLTDTSYKTAQQRTGPNPALAALDILIGTWQVSGLTTPPEKEIAGKVVFEWQEGGYFLIQQVDINYPGQTIKGIEYIGYDQQSRLVKSHFFETSGNLSEYVWELSKDRLTVWGGYVGSPASLKAAFGPDKGTISGRWKWPGGGYDFIWTKEK